MSINGLFRSLDSNSLTSLSTNEELVNNRRIEIENLRNAQNLLRKKYRLLSLLRSELTNCRCECWDKSSTNTSILSHLLKSEFNCKMWFRQIKVIETKVECNRQSLPFDVLKVMRQLLDTNQLNINSIGIPLDSNNNNHNNNDIESNGFQTNSDSDMKIENFSPNDDSVNQLAQNEYSFNTTDEELTANEFENENSFSSSTKNMQILRYDSLLNSESCLTLQPINNNDLTTNGEMEGEGQTFQELHPISSNVGLNYCAHEISLIRSNPSLQYHSFDYTTNCNTTSTDNHFSDDILPSLPSLPQITAIEIDQILNN